jgi:protein-tyrosine phosphatase
LTLIYLGSSIALLSAALLGKLWILLWPSFSLSLVAAAYYTGDAGWIGKRNGRLPFWMWPYEFGAWLNSRIWNRHLPPHDEIAPGVFLGRFPSRAERKCFASIVDVTAELSLPGATNVPILDFGPRNEAQIEAASAALEAAPRPTLVCCALGVSRSSAVAAHWLHVTGRAPSLEAARAHLKSIRPQVRV